MILFMLFFDSCGELEGDVVLVFIRVGLFKIDSFRIEDLNFCVRDIIVDGSCCESLSLLFGKIFIFKNNMYKR